MIVEHREREVILRLAKNMKKQDLQDIIEFIEHKEITKKSKASQKDVDNLVKEVKKGRWQRTAVLISNYKFN